MPSLIASYKESRDVKATATAVGGGSSVQTPAVTHLPESPEFVPSRRTGGPVARKLTGFERTLVSIEDHPWAALYRMAVGFVAMPIVSFAWKGQASAVAAIATLLGILLMLRFLPMVFRGVLSFSEPVQKIWDDRRQAAKRHDSYQWRKLFWIGVGLAAYVVLTGQFGVANVSVGAICLMSGAAGVLRWRAINSQVRSSNENQ
jgi:hypothetical protein